MIFIFMRIIISIIFLVLAYPETGLFTTIILSYLLLHAECTNIIYDKQLKDNKILQDFLKERIHKP